MSQLYQPLDFQKIHVWFPFDTHCTVEINLIFRWIEWYFVYLHKWTWWFFWLICQQWKGPLVEWPYWLILMILMISQVSSATVKLVKRVKNGRSEEAARQSNLSDTAGFHPPVRGGRAWNGLLSSRHLSQLSLTDQPWDEGNHAKVREE